MANTGQYIGVVMLSILNPYGRVLLCKEENLCYFLTFIIEELFKITVLNTGINKFLNQISKFSETWLHERSRDLQICLTCGGIPFVQSFTFPGIN